jgi:hypothetical protein
VPRMHRRVCVVGVLYVRDTLSENGRWVWAFWHVDGQVRHQYYNNMPARHLCSTLK